MLLFLTLLGYTFISIFASWSWTNRQMPYLLAGADTDLVTGVAVANAEGVDAAAAAGAAAVIDDILRSLRSGLLCSLMRYLWYLAKL